MQYTEFVKTIRERANLESEAATLQAIEATFTTLSERMAGNEAGNLAAQLPAQIQPFLTGAVDNMGASFGVDEFFRRVAEKEGVDIPTATEHAQTVMWVMSEAVSRGELNDIRHQFPANYALLFQLTERGLPNNSQEAHNQPF